MYKNYKKNYPYNEVTFVRDFKHMLEESKTVCEGRPAFKYKKGTDVVDVSYEQFFKETKALGSAITELGCGSKHVAMIGPNSYKYATIYLTMLNSDTGVFVPIDRELPFEEIMYIINDSDAEMFFFADFYAENVKAHRDEMPNVKYFVNIEAKEDADGILSYDKLMEKGMALLDGGYTAYTDMTPVLEDLKMIVYTSGTTGKAKGVMLSLSNMVNMVCYGLQVADVYERCLSVLPYHHTYELVCNLLVSMKKGATICINESIRTVAPNLKLYKPKFVMLVPLYVESFYKKIWANLEDSGKAGLVRKMIKVSNGLLKIGIDVRKKLFGQLHEVFGGELDKIVCGGAPMREEVGNFFTSIGVAVLNGYGITECSPLVSVNRDYFFNFSSVGNKLACLELKIENPNEDGEGEICVKGPTVMMGYYKKPEMTAEVIVDGWFHTGDYGKVDPKDDRLYITGRKKNIIVLK
ncbi:MAG: AMP-binding protein, partial [Clostridia bacterium]|nr:AMP-binding protein [Clostridia bacterium]